MAQTTRTNTADRPVRRRGTRHNSELENAITRTYRSAAVKMTSGSAASVKNTRTKIPPLNDDEIELPTVIEEPRVRVKHLTITPPRFGLAAISIEGIAPYVQHNFSEKARRLMEERMEAGTIGKNTRRAKAARDFNAEYLAAAHVMQNGRHGIPAAAFRNSMITACSLVGYAMTKAKMTIFVLADGYDRESATPLVEIFGKPEVKEAAVRIQNSTSSVWRPMWEKWSAVVRVEWDLDQFSETDVLNLLARAGRQVGIGEGRPASRNSAGLGWGLFQVAHRMKAN